MKETWNFGPIWQTKYASAIRWRRFPHWASVVLCSTQSNKWQQFSRCNKAQDNLVWYFWPGLRWYYFTIYRGSPDSTIFAPPGNCTIEKTILFRCWFSTKIAIYDSWILKVPFFAHFQAILIFETKKGWFFGFILKC